MRRIFFLFLFLLLTVLTVNSFSLSIPSTSTGSLSMVIKSLDIHPDSFNRYFTIDGHVFAYSYDVNSNSSELVLVNGTTGEASTYGNVIDTTPGVQDMLTFVLKGTTIDVYFNGVKVGCKLGYLGNVNIGGNVVLTDFVIPGTFAYNRSILSSVQVMESYNTYKNHGNYGATVIERFFNEVFSLMRGY